MPEWFVAQFLGAMLALRCLRLAKPYQIRREYLQPLSHHQPLGSPQRETAPRMRGAYALAGHYEEAQAEAAEVLRLNPKFSLEVHKQRMPIRDPAVAERIIAALRRAGLQ